MRFAVACGSHACTRLGVIPALGWRAEMTLSPNITRDGMERGTILDAELNHAIGSMGPGDLVIVCDAGFPILRTAWRIDLALKADVPNLADLLGCIAGDFVAEKAAHADTLPARNPILLETVRRLFREADHETITHEAVLEQMAAMAKVIVRTGDSDPWGNISLTSGVDVPRWFDRPGVVPRASSPWRASGLARVDPRATPR